MKKLAKYASKKTASPDIASSALLVIDMQNFFLDKKSHAYVPSAPIVLQNILEIVRLFRQKSRPIVFTYYAVKTGESPGIMGEWWNDVVYENQDDAKIVSELAPQPLDIVIRKKTYSAFYETDLEELLRSKKVTQLVVTGLLTNLCCETTARDAFVRDFRVFFVADGTAAYNEEMHLASLKNLAYGFVTPLTTKQLQEAAMDV